MSELEDDRDKLELYSLPDGEQVDVAQYTGVMWSNFLVKVTTRTAEFRTVCGFLGRPSIANAVQQAVAVVQAVADECVDQCLSRF